MKPPVAPETVFDKGKSGTERFRRAKATGTMLLDVATVSKYQKREQFNEYWKTLTKGERAINAKSNSLRDKYHLGETDGMVFTTPTREGGSITAVAVAHDKEHTEETLWDIKIVSAAGRNSQFIVDSQTIYRGSVSENEYPPTIKVVDPKTSKQHHASDDLDAMSSVSMALERLQHADSQGTLVAVEMPAGVLSQQTPDLLAA